MRRFYVDFKTWEINAEDEEQAEVIAIGKLRGGNIPLISSVDDTDEEEPLEEDLIESIKLEDLRDGKT